MCIMPVSISSNFLSLIWPYEYLIGNMRYSYYKYNLYYLVLNSGSPWSGPFLVFYFSNMTPFSDAGNNFGSKVIAMNFIKWYNENIFIFPNISD